MNFDFLSPYKIGYEIIDQSKVREVGQLRHYFFDVPDIYIQRAVATFSPFPVELLEFYKEIGFGFFHRRKNIENRLLDPMSMVYMNRQEGYFANEIVKEYLNYYNPEQYLLFFQASDSCFLAISRRAEKGKNAIWYKNNMLEDSLSDFLRLCCDNADYLPLRISRIDYLDNKDRRKQEKARQKEAEKSAPKIKYLGGHQLIDNW